MTEIYTLNPGDPCVECHETGCGNNKLRFFYINNEEQILKCESSTCMWPYNDEVSTDEESEDEDFERKMVTQVPCAIDIAPDCHKNLQIGQATTRDVKSAETDKKTVLPIDFNSDFNTAVETLLNEDDFSIDSNFTSDSRNNVYTNQISSTTTPTNIDFVNKKVQPNSPVLSFEWNMQENTLVPIQEQEQQKSSQDNLIDYSMPLIDFDSILEIPETRLEVITTQSGVEEQITLPIAQYYIESSVKETTNKYKHKEPVDATNTVNELIPNTVLTNPSTTKNYAIKAPEIFVESKLSKSQLAACAKMDDIPKADIKRNTRRRHQYVKTENKSPRLAKVLELLETYKAQNEKAKKNQY